MAARRLDRLEKLAAELDGARAIACDVADPDAVRNLVETTLAGTGRIDVLVNNAGLANPMPAEDEPLEVFREVLDVNLVGLFHLSQTGGGPMLAPATGSSSTSPPSWGWWPPASCPRPATWPARAAVVNLTRELGVQWARRGMRVNAIAPGWFPSEMTEEMFSEESGQRWIRRNTPMGRGGEDQRARRRPALPGLRRQHLRDRPDPRGRRGLDGPLTG